MTNSATPASRPLGVADCGLFFLTSSSPQELRRHAVVAEDEGVGSLWLAEVPHWFRTFGDESRAAPSCAALIAASTHRLRIGLGIVSPYLRHPTVLAAEAWTLAELSGGRFVLGLGASKVAMSTLNLDRQRPPVTVHREALQIIRAIFTGAEIHLHGAVFDTDVPARAAGLAVPPTPPVVLGATGAKLLRLAGEAFDGVLLPTLSSPGFVRKALVEVAAGATRSGRAVDDFPVGVAVLTSVDRDAARARAKARPVAARWLQNKLLNIKNDTILSEAGFSTHELDDLRAVATDVARLATMLDDEALERCGVIAGSPEHCARLLGALVEAGTTMPMFCIASRDPDDISVQIRSLARDVIPAMRATAAAEQQSSAPRTLARRLDHPNNAFLAGRPIVGNDVTAPARAVDEKAVMRREADEIAPYDRRRSVPDLLGRDLVGRAALPRR